MRDGMNRTFDGVSSPFPLFSFSPPNKPYKRRDLGALPVFQLGHDKIEGPAGYAYMLTSTKFNREISLNKKN